MFRIEVPGFVSIGSREEIEKPLGSLWGVDDLSDLTEEEEEEEAKTTKNARTNAMAVHSKSALRISAPAELMLQCCAFLQSAQCYCCLRRVSKSFYYLLDTPHTGAPLWSPLHASRRRESLGTIRCSKRIIMPKREEQAYTRVRICSKEDPSDAPPHPSPLRADYYMAYRDMQISEKRLREWGVLGSAWEWLQRWLRKELDDLRGVAGEAGTVTGRQKKEGGDRAVEGAVRKLLRAANYLLYDSVREEFDLAAFRLARDVVQQFEEAKNIGPPKGQALSVILKAWEEYKAWASAVSESLELLDDRISIARYNARPGCASDNPFLYDAAHISFRNNFILNLQISATLMGIIERALEEQEESACSSGKETLSSSVYFTELELVEDCRVMDFSVQNERRVTTKQIKTTPQESEGRIKLRSLLDMLIELDKGDDSVSGVRQTQGSLRALFLVPLLRWAKR